MAKIIFTVDNINYKGGGHFATFKIANYLCSCGHGVILYSPVKAEASVRAELADGIVVSQRASFSDADYIVVPFENSAFFEKIANLKTRASCRTIRSAEGSCSQPMTGSFLFRNITGTTF